MSYSIDTNHDENGFYAYLCNSDGYEIERGQSRKTKRAAERDAQAWSSETGIWCECQRFKTARRIFTDCWFWLHRRRLI
jgi:hypothetical protein